MIQRRREIFGTPELPAGFGLRQPSGAFGSRPIFESVRGLAQSKTLRVRQCAAEIFASLRLCVFALKFEITNG
jgi:hypothetical protein